MMASSLPQVYEPTPFPGVGNVKYLVPAGAQHSTTKHDTAQHTHRKKVTWSNAARHRHEHECDGAEQGRVAENVVSFLSAATRQHTARHAEATQRPRGHTEATQEADIRGWKTVSNIAHDGFGERSLASRALVTKRSLAVKAADCVPYGHNVARPHRRQRLRMQHLNHGGVNTGI